MAAEQTTALAVAPEHELSVFPVAATSLDQARHHYQELRQFAKSLLTESRDGNGDYGIVPYSGAKKPSLFKSGAEKLAQIYGYAPDFELVQETAVFDDPHYERSAGRPYFAFTYKCSLRSKRTGALVASCVGECNTNEERFRKRDGSWMDAWTHRNPAAKMAQKRALVGATLIGCAASSLFTQDLEDYAQEPPAAPTRAQAPTSRPVQREIVAPAAPSVPSGAADRMLSAKETLKLREDITAIFRRQGWRDEDTREAVAEHMSALGKESVNALTLHESQAFRRWAEETAAGGVPATEAPDAPDISADEADANAHFAEL